jgi:hypothetical protein
LRPAGWVEPTGLAFGKPKDKLLETHRFLFGKLVNGLKI